MSLEPKAVALARADMLKKLRAHFDRTDAIEVETALFAHAPGTDPNIQPMSVNTGYTIAWAQTSPEFAMKRLLAAGVPDCYQITKAIRLGEIGARHHFEFTLLEFYRLNYSLGDLVSETLEILAQVLDLKTLTQHTYASLFEKHIGICPHSASFDSLKALVIKQGLPTPEDKADALESLFGICIEPKLQGTVVITHFPEALAMLSEVSSGLAERFEIVHNKMEIANGFKELRCPVTQRARMIADNAKRQAIGEPIMPLDEAFLSDLGNMPDCAGVAIGLDRLLMLKLGVDIESVRHFIQPLRQVRHQA